LDAARIGTKTFKSFSSAINLNVLNDFKVLKKQPALEKLKPPPVFRENFNRKAAEPQRGIFAPLCFGEGQISPAMSG